MMTGAEERGNDPAESEIGRNRSHPRLPPAAKGGGEFFARLRRHEECADIAPQSGGKSFKNGHRGIFDATFEPADIGPVDTRIDGKVVLRDSPVNPNLPHVVGDKLLRLHPPRKTTCRPLNQGLWSQGIFSSVSEKRRRHGER